MARRYVLLMLLCKSFTFALKDKNCHRIALLTAEPLPTEWCSCSDLAGECSNTQLSTPAQLNICNSFRDKLKTIFKSTRQHARNLATFAVIYKTAMLFLRRLNPAQKEEAPHTFLAGLLGGYFVFGRGKSGQSSVNQQIVIYVFARVVLGLAKLSVQRKRAGGLGLSPDVKDRLNENAWPLFAALSWGMVMWLFRWYPEVLQPSLNSSMKYMYVARIT